MALYECPECGNMVSDRAAKCPKCGFPLKKETPVVQVDADGHGASDAEPKASEQPVKKKSRKIIVIIISAVLLITIAVVLVIVFSSSNNADKEESSKSEAAARVIGKIDAMGEVTLQSKDRIEEIAEEYTKLSEEEKKQVTNYSKLQNARSKISMLESEKEAKEEAKQTTDKKNKATFKELSNKLNEVNQLSNSFIDGMQYYKDAESLYTFIQNHMYENQRASNLLGEAARLCNTLPGASGLRTYINQAKGNLPVSLASSDYSAEQRYLNQLKGFCRSMADVFTELGKISKSYQ